MENNQQYLNPETYLTMIQDLGATIGNLNLELSLSKAQYKEMLEYAQRLQAEINSYKKEPMPKEEEIVSE